MVRHLLFRILSVAGICAILCSTASAQAKKPEPEHTIWVKFDSDPPNAEIFALPPEDSDSELGPRLGIAPCVVPVDLTWGRKMLKKRWDMLEIWCAADACRAEFNENSDYDIFLPVIAIKDGYTRKRVDGKVLTLKNPGPDWSGKLLWPKQGEVLIQLARTGEKKSSEATAQQPTAPTGLRRVILGGASGGAPASAGTLTVYCNIPGSDLFIDRRYAGTTPLQVVLSAGAHTIQIQKPGLAPVRKDIHITEDTELIYRANLTP